MKNRKRQRENRKKKNEILEIRNSTGVLGHAVLHMRDGYFIAKNQGMEKQINEAS